MRTYSAFAPWRMIAFRVLTRSPLLPIVHWPSFSQQLIAREDERSDHWRAFLLSLGERTRIAGSGSRLTASGILHHPAPTLLAHLSPRARTPTHTSALPRREQEAAE
jgi:hypothetical protein